MSGLDRREDSELNPEKEGPERIWWCSAEVLTENGIVTHSDVLIILRCPILFSKSGEYFNPSTEPVWSFLKRVCQSILTNHFNLKEMFPYNDIQAAVLSIYSNRYLPQRMRQCVIDCCCARKRAARDPFFESMGYDRLFSRHSGVVEE